MSDKSIEKEYKQMVMDEDRNREAVKWTELGKSTIRKSKNVWHTDVPHCSESKPNHRERNIGE